jgi:hypothetical protein
MFFGRRPYSLASRSVLCHLQTPEKIQMVVRIFIGALDGFGCSNMDRRVQKLADLVLNYFPVFLFSGCAK